MDNSFFLKTAIEDLFLNTSIENAEDLATCLSYNDLYSISSVSNESINTAIPVDNSDVSKI